jgi:TRAP-type C4-dicarboxylate transport system substrate-binding protein
MQQNPRFGRRAFLRLGTGAVLAAATSACSQRVGDGRSVIYASGFSLAKSVDEALWFEFEQRVEQQRRDFDVRLLIRGETGPEEQMLSMLRRGRLQVAGGSFAGLATLVPEIALLSSPFLFDSEAEVDFVMDRYMTPLFRELFTAKGLHLMQWTDIGWVNLYGQRALTLPSELRGRRIRASSSLASQAFISEVGADTITLPFSEVVPSLQTGLIEGGVTSVTMYTLSGISTEAPHFVLTQHSYDMGVMLANGAWFATLDRVGQRVVENGFGGAAHARRSARAAVAALEQVLPSKGVTVHRPTPEQRAAWREAAWPSHQRLVERIGGAAPRVYAALTTGLTAFRATRPS